MFKDIKTGDLLYLIDTDPNTLIPMYSEVTVESTTPEYIAPNAVFNQNKVVDIKFAYKVSDRDSIELSQIDGTNYNIEIGRYNISCTKTLAMAEVRKIHKKYQEYINNMEIYKKIETSCSEILSKNGLSSKSDAERIGSLESGLESLKNDIGDIKSLLQSFSKQENKKHDTVLYR